MAAAAASGEPALQSFVTGLRADQDAVTAGLTLRWSSGSAEGNITAKRLLPVSALTLLTRGVAHVIDQVLVLSCFTGRAPFLSW
jgi:hypothetical protein